MPNHRHNPQVKKPSTSYPRSHSGLKKGYGLFEGFAFRLPNVFRRPKAVYSSPADDRSFLYHVHTLWLFTYSDIKTVILPQTVFGCVALACREPFRISDPAIPSNALIKIPLIILWIWIALLGEVISNQRLAGSVIEDSINKPWRPLPSKRVTPDDARSLLLWILPISYLVGIVIGGSDASVALMVFSYMYNDLHGANESWLWRNLLNALGLSSFSIGAAEVAWGPDTVLSDTVYAWVAILGGVIISTVQLQDLPDVEGDRARDRKTMMRSYSEASVRWSICIPTLFWSFYCPFFWGLNGVGYIPSLVLGFVIIVRLLIKRHPAADLITWRLWCTWMGTLYSLPLLVTCRILR
jgi:4-hydroxybenzoate polyprenyltransferase